MIGNNRKNKILVLSDLGKDTKSLLMSTVAMAKLVDGDVQLLHVKKPIEVIDSDSHLSAHRTLNKIQIDTDNEIRRLINPFCDNHKIKINYKSVVGKLDDEIESQIKAEKPDIIVLGKRKAGVLSIIGDNIMDFILKKHNGPVFIDSGQKSLEPNAEFSFGLYNDDGNLENLNFKEQLISKVKKPFKSFSIVKNSKKEEGVSSKSNNNIVNYKFTSGSNAIGNMVNYINKNKVDLLFIGRDNKSALKTDTKKIINTCNASVLIN